MPENALEPYAPLNVLKPVAPEVWIVDGPTIFMTAGPLRMPFSTRMTAVRLSNGDLWLHSPTAPTERLLTSVASLGPVRSLIAPNVLHYWWIPDWKDRYPEATIYAVPDLERSAKRPIQVDCRLENEAPRRWVGQLDQLLVKGGWFSEAVFFHRSSRTLILTDLIENFELKRVRHWYYRALIRLGGVAHPDGKMPLDMRLLFRRRRTALKRAVQQMIAWDPRRIILAHGRWYDGNAVAELRRAFRWLL